MFQRILVPVDGSETSTKALVAALELARNTDGRVRILHFLDELGMSGFAYGVDLKGLARDQADEVLQNALAVARSAGIPADTHLVEASGQRLGEVVADEAQVWEADLIVMGTHGRRGVSQTLLGSGAEQVFRIAPVPVLSIRGSDETEPS